MQIARFLPKKPRTKNNKMIPNQPKANIEMAEKMKWDSKSLEKQSHRPKRFRIRHGEIARENIRKVMKLMGMKIYGLSVKGYGRVKDICANMRISSGQQASLMKTKLGGKSQMYSLEDRQKQLAVYQRNSNGYIITCLSMRSPNEVLADSPVVLWRAPNGQPCPLGA